MERRHCLSLPATRTSLCFASCARYSRRHASSTLIPQGAVLSGFHPETGEARITLITLKKRQLSLLFVQKTPGRGLIFAQTTAPGNRQVLNFASLIMLHAVRQTGNDGILCLFQRIVDDEREVVRSMTGVRIEGGKTDLIVAVRGEISDAGIAAGVAGLPRWGHHPSPEPATGRAPDSRQASHAPSPGVAACAGRSPGSLPGTLSRICRRL